MLRSTHIYHLWKVLVHIFSGKIHLFFTCSIMLIKAWSHAYTRHCSLFDVSLHVLLVKEGRSWLGWLVPTMPAIKNVPHALVASKNFVKFFSRARVGQLIIYKPSPWVDCFQFKLFIFFKDHVTKNRSDVNSPEIVQWSYIFLLNKWWLLGTLLCFSLSVFWYMYQ